MHEERSSSRCDGRHPGCRSERAASHRPPTTLAGYRLRGPDTSPPGIHLAVTHVFENGRSEQDEQVAGSQIPPGAEIAEEHRDERRRGAKEEGRREHHAKVIPVENTDER